MGMEMAFDYGKWYQENKEKLSRQKRTRYRRDSAYQKKVYSQALDRYHKVLKKPYIADRRIIKTEDDRLFSIGRVSELIGRTEVTLRQYHRMGIVPDPLHYDTRGWRLYTRAQAILLQLTFRKFDRGEFKSLREVKNYLQTQEW